MEKCRTRIWSSVISAFSQIQLQISVAVLALVHTCHLDVNPFSILLSYEKLSRIKLKIATRKYWTWKYCYEIPTASLCSCEYLKINESCNDKIHYKTMILYLNYKNNVYKVENVNKRSSRWENNPKTLQHSLWTTLNFIYVSFIIYFIQIRLIWKLLYPSIYR